MRPRRCRELRDEDASARRELPRLAAGRTHDDTARRGRTHRGINAAWGATGDDLVTGSN